MYHHFQNALRTRLHFLVHGTHNSEAAQKPYRKDIMRTLEEARAELHAQYPQRIPRKYTSRKPKVQQKRGVQPVIPLPSVRRVHFIRYAKKQEMPPAIMRLMEREQVHMVCKPEDIEHLRDKIQWHNMKFGVIRERYHSVRKPHLKDC